MTKLMLIDASHEEETRVVLTDEQGRIDELDFVSSSRQQIKSNIYLAKITRVEPSLQCAFVEYGGGKQGFLSISEIHPDYYQIPIADREKLLEEEAKQQEDEEKREAAREAADEKRRSRRKPRQKDVDDNDDNDDAEEKADKDEKPKKGRKRTFAARAKAGEDLAVSDEVTEADENPETSDTDKADADKDEKPKKKTAAKGKKKADADSDKEEDKEDAKKGAANDKETDNKDVDDEHHDDDDNAADVEVIDDEEEIDEERSSSRRVSTKRYKIQEVIKHGQIVLVQVIKEQRGNKGVSLSTYVSLPGRYCVLMPNSSKGGGISRKISNRNDRKRLKEIASELKDARGISAIIRTAGIDRTKADIKRDYEYLLKLWNQIREDAINSTAPALVYEEGDVIKRSIRDYYHSDIEKVHVQGEEAYKTAKEFMKILMPSHAPRVKHYTEDTPLFYEYDIESQLQSIHTTRARLRSGGYLDINPTEALISVDVNSGRSTSERNVEETALKTNLEAAAELGRQMRLRDLGGLIVIDFIDMYQGKNRRAVERAMKEALKSDRAKIQMARISAFGLMEMSRQRLRPSMSETTSSQCPRCEGTGMVRSPESLAIEAVRVLEKEAASGNYRELRLSVHNDLAVYMLNHSRQLITDIEKQSGVAISIKVDANPNAEYTLERVLHNGNIDRNDNSNKPRRTRGGRNRKPRGGKDNNSQQNSGSEAQSDDNNKPEKNDDEGNNSGRGRRRRRGPRGNRGPRNKDAANQNNKQSDDISSDNKTADGAPAAKTEDVKKPEAKTPEKAAPVKAAKEEKKPAAKKPATKKAEAEDKAEKKKPAAKKPAAKKAETPAVKDTPVDPNAPKKKGWWRKVVE